MRLPDLLEPTYIQMLGALSGWLDKAGAHGEAADALLAARHAPDMFPLPTQVRFACVQAFEGVCRLRGQDFLATVAILLDEGRSGGEHPGSIADARMRIAETIAFVEAAAAQPATLDAAMSIAHALPGGMVFDLTADQYARDWALPQFYFHVMASYTILRVAGADLGKAYYVAHMFGYLRPGSLPETA